MATLREIREANYISRRELAELSGVAESTIVRTETTQTHTTKELAEKILDALGQRIGQNLTLENVEGFNLYNIMRDRKQRGKKGI